MGFQVYGPLLKNTFSTPETRDIFGTDGFVDQFLNVEAALARAQAAHGLVPEDAAQELTEHASSEHVDIEVVERYLSERGLLSMAIIEGWKAHLGEVGEYVHWGSTSQDIIDTTVVLQVRDGLNLIIARLHDLEERLAALVREHADTPMIGRTHHVHAVPTTFGLKAASWLDEVTRGVDRLEQVLEEISVCQFGGAIGTYATLGPSGPAIGESFAEELDLSVPPMGWHAARDRISTLLATIATVAGTMSRIAKQVLLLGRLEIGELTEVVPDGAVGSSTMPHKQNPKRAETTVMLARLVRSGPRTMLELMNTADERDASTWYGEYAIIPETFTRADRCVELTAELVDNLEVHPDRMKQNLFVHGSLVASENVMMGLAEHVGRATAHDIVHENAMAVRSGEEFLERLLEDDRVTDVLTPEQVASLADPASYTGLASDVARRVADEHPRVE